jgi:hypothetical protein
MMSAVELNKSNPRIQFPQSRIISQAIHGSNPISLHIYPLTLPVVAGAKALAEAAKATVQAAANFMVC